MKEASGELSMTAVAAIAIGAIAVIFTTLVLPSLRTNITRNTLCSQAYECTAPSGGGKGNLVTCKYLDEDGTEKTVKCKWEAVNVN